MTFKQWKAFYLQISCLEELLSLYVFLNLLFALIFIDEQSQMVGTEKRSHANRQRTWWKGKGAYFRPRFFFSRSTFIGKTRLGFSPLSRNNKNGGIYAKVSGFRFWVVPIGLIQHQLLKRRQLMDKGTSDSSVATAVSKTNPTTTPDGAPTGDSRFILFLFSWVVH